MEATQLYGRAIDAGKRCGAAREELRATYESLGLAQTRSGLYADAKRSFADAHHLADDPVVRAKMMLRRAYIEEYVGSYPRALGWLTRASHVLADVDATDARGVEVETRYRRGAIIYNVGRIAEAADLMQEVIPIADAIGAEEVLGNAHNVLGNALAWLGRPGADDEFRKALAIHERRGFVPGQAMVYLNLGATAYWRGAGRTRPSCTGALELHTRTANPIEAAFAEMNIAEVYLEQGKLDEAEVLLRDASRELRILPRVPGTRRFADLPRSRPGAGGPARSRPRELLRQARGPSTRG